MAHSAAKQKTKEVVGKLISSLLVGNVGNLECKRLSTVCISLEKKHLLQACLEKKGGRHFLVPMPFCLGPVGASLLFCSLMRRRGAEGGEGRWTDGRRARKAARGFVLLIVAAEVARVSGFISA